MHAKTPLCNSTLFAELLSLPQVVGSSVISKYTGALCFRNKVTEVEGHSTVLTMFHEFKGASMTKIRRAQGLKDVERASRQCVLLYIIVSRKLLPITTLTGDQFLAPWWQIVTGHRTLWKKGVRHCNISLSNFMGYHVDGRFIGVLIDFDLSSTTRDGPSGLERIAGTIPFMSLDLLIPVADARKVEHMYWHDAESFIWVLTWICLRYDNGKLLRRNRPLDEWLTVDAMGCHKKKMSFLGRLRSMRPTHSHEGNFKVALQCLEVIIKLISPSTSVPEDEVVFQEWLQNHVPERVRDLAGNLLPAQEGRYTCR